MEFSGNVVRRAIRFLFKTMIWVFIVFALFVGSLCFREQQLPRFAVSKICSMLSTDRFLVMCGRIAFGFRSGLRLSDVKVYDSGRKSMVEPLASARAAKVDFFGRSVEIDGLVAPRLGDSYYEPGNVEIKNSLDFELPELGEFDLRLRSPQILGIAPREVAAKVNVSRHHADILKVDVDWGGSRRALHLSGFLSVDLDGAILRGEVRGLSLPELIRPLIVALDVPIAVEYMDAFTGVVEPVPAWCGWEVRLDNCDLRLSLELNPKLGRYRGVPVDSATGRIELSNMTRGTNFIYKTEIGPLVATDPNGGRLEGKVTIRGSTEERPQISLDAKSGFSLKDVLVFTEVLDDGLLDPLECVDPPKLEFSGTLATCAEDQPRNDLHGKGELGRGSLFGARFAGATLDCSYVGSDFAFTNVVATGLRGGKLKGSAIMSIPGLDAEMARFRVSGEYNGTVEEFIEVFGLEDDGRRSGSLSGNFEFEGPIGSNVVSRLCGKGSISSKDGRLSQLKLFAGLTEVLADKVPGVGAIVNQSSGSCDFAITNGVLSSENILIEGGLFSIRGKGALDLNTGSLDFTLRVQFFRKDSIIDTLVSPVTWAFSKLLMEVHLGGTLDEPKWRYISVIDRVL